MTIAEQARQAFRNIRTPPAEAGARLAVVVRVRYYAPDPPDRPSIAPVLGEAFGTIRPGAVLLRSPGPGMRIEIEMPARRGGAG